MPNVTSLQNINFGSLFINYFGFQNEENLKEILPHIQIDSIVNYLSALYIKNRSASPEEVDLMKVKSFSFFNYSFEFSLSLSEGF